MAEANPPPRFIAGTCSVCGAKTYREAETRCQVTRDCMDEYECKGGAVDDSLVPGGAAGRLYFRNPALAAWEDARIDAMMAKERRK